MKVVEKSNDILKYLERRNLKNAYIVKAYNLYSHKFC